jgi:hypothetical protein
MVQVPIQEDIDAILERLDALEQDNEFLRGFIVDLQWLTVTQVAKAIGCSQHKVYGLL